MDTSDALEAVLVPLADRPGMRAPDYGAENALLLWLADELAHTPGRIFDKLAEAAMQLTGTSIARTIA